MGKEEQLAVDGSRLAGTADDDDGAAPLEGVVVAVVA